MKNRIFQVLRVLVCVIVVCAMLVNASPIRAKATGVGTAALYALGAVAVEVVVAAAFQALGVMSGSESSTFRSYVNDAVTWLTNSTTYVTNGMVQVLGFMSPDGVVKSFALKDMIQDLWQWMFDQNVVSLDSVYPSAYSGVFTNHYGTVSFTSTAPCSVGIGVVGSRIITLIWSTVPFEFSYLDSIVSASLYDCGLYAYFMGNSISNCPEYTTWNLNLGTYNVSQSSNSKAATWLMNNVVSSAYDDVVYSSIEGLVLGQIQGPYDGNTVLKLEEAETYEQYATKIIEFPTNPDDDTENQPLNVPWLPVGLPSTDLDEILTQNQDQAQSGDTSIDFDFETSTDPGTGTDPDTGTDTDPDVDPNPDPNPDPGTDTENNPIKDFANVAPGDFVFDVPWMDFFPFCIPKDILDLVRVFDAEPEAPRFVFDIDFPYMDEPWHIDIDFSAWDPVALVMRRLELLLFVVGLAMATRNYYIRG